MNSEERDIINGIFQRLEQASGQPRDADAERFIAEKLRSQPYAPYAMAQLIYVQEEAIKSLNQQLEQVQAENEQLRQQASQRNQGGGSFLSSIFGGGQQHRSGRLGLHWNTTVLWPLVSTRCSTCQRTARASTTHSTSRPTAVRSSADSEWFTRSTSCSMIGPSSRSAVT